MAMGERQRILPQVDRPEAREFWRGCRERQLKLPRCRNCQRYHWYPLAACPFCQGADLEWAPVSGRATLFTWTEVRYPFVPELADRLPLLVALVSLVEAPEIRFVTNLVDCTEHDLRIGMPMEVVFRDLTATVTVPLFRPRAAT